MANVANIKLWIEALRSGKYRQAKSGLGRMVKHDDTARVTWEFCVLGVACEVAIESGVSVKRFLIPYRSRPLRDDWKPRDVVGRITYGHSLDESDAYTLPYIVAHWLGLSENPKLASGDYLSYANDVGTPFEVLASVIESEYLPK